MSPLIRIGSLVMTPEQLGRALKEDMTVSQARKMIEEDKSPVMDNIEGDSNPDVGEVDVGHDD